MGYSNYSNKRTIPTKITTKKSSPITTNFAKGIYTYKPNDTMSQDEIRLAENARFDRVGEYKTRKGFKQMSRSNVASVYDKYYSAIGHGTLVGNWNSRENPPTAKATELTPFTTTAASSSRVYRADVTLARTKEQTNAIPKITLKVDGAVVDSAYVDPSDIVYGAPVFVSAYFNNAPDISEGQSIELSITIEKGDADDYNIVYVGDHVLMVALKSCSSGGVSSVFEANIGGTRTVLFVQNGSLYRLRADSASPALVRSLPSGVGKVRFSQNLDQIRYADGKEGPRLIDPTNWNDSAIATTDLKTGTNLNISVNNIMNGTADNLVYGVVNPDTEAVWTYPYGYTYAKSPSFTTTATISGSVGTTLSVNVSTISPSGIHVGDWITGQGTGTAEVTSISGSTVNLRIVDTTPQTISSYDKFSSDFYQNFPAIKTGDPLTAMFNLGGVLYFMTRRNKYMMYSQTAESWSQSTCNAQNGTFSQESLVCDLNYAYYANDKGIYIFDGSSEASLTEKSIQNVYDAIPNKESIVLDLYDNRLFCFYSDDGTVNNRCLIYNTNLRVWESFDSNTYVSATSGRQNSSNRFLCGHSRIGLIMLADDGNYADMGSPIAFNLETSYLHFGTTSQLKRITKWRPEFATATRPYTVECGYSLDYTDQVHYAFSIDLQRQIPIMTDYVWDNPSDYGVPAIPTKHTTIPQVNGEFYRCQIRYQHIAAFEPVIFRSHTLTIQTQRIR